MLAVTDESFEELILRSDLPVMVEFYGEECGPCKSIEPVLDRLAEELCGNAVIAKISVDKNLRIPGDYKIRAVPTFLYFRDGKLTSKHIGATSVREMYLRLMAG